MTFNPRMREIIPKRPYSSKWERELFEVQCVEYKLPKTLHTFENIQARRDTVSQKLFPKDSFVKATPVKCFGDGNCLFRAVSQILQGDENLHLELHVVIEMAMNIDLYCSNEHIIAMNTNVQITDPVDILWH